MEVGVDALTWGPCRVSENARDIYTIDLPRSSIEKHSVDSAWDIHLKSVEAGGACVLTASKARHSSACNVFNPLSVHTFTILKKSGMGFNVKFEFRGFDGLHYVCLRAFFPFLLIAAD